MPDPTSRPAPTVRADRLDLIDLWKYFESRGQELKTAMLSLVTWLTGFAAATLALAVRLMVDFDTAAGRVSHPLLLAALALIGFGIVIYSHIVIYEYADHINRTFDRSSTIRRIDSSLDPILGPFSAEPPPALPKICRHARAVVRTFGVAFLLVLLFTLVQISCSCPN